MLSNLQVACYRRRSQNATVWLRVVQEAGAEFPNAGLLRIRAVVPKIRGLLLQLDERRRRYRLSDCRAGIRLAHRRFDNAMRWRQRAGGIGCRGVSGQQKSLAAAAAEIFAAAIATAARLGHPVFATETAGTTDDSCQIHSSVFSRTFSNDKPGSTSAAWQGSTLPAGLISINLRPQPPMQALGYFA